MSRRYFMAQWVTNEQGFIVCSAESVWRAAGLSWRLLADETPNQQPFTDPNVWFGFVEADDPDALIAALEAADA